jgi:phosphoacetylglucosamine mutase
MKMEKTTTSFALLPLETRRKFIRLCLLSPPPPTKDDDDDENNGIFFSYGTAGFRCNHALLDAVAFRCGFIAGCVAAYEDEEEGGGASGICVTASHNEASDNGLKIVDGRGHVLSERYESACELVCNARTEEALEKALDAFEEKVLAFKKEREKSRVGAAVVYFGRDTRESGERLVERAKEGARVLGEDVVKICDRGVVTTPMLHYFVYAHGKAVEAFYEEEEEKQKKEGREEEMDAIAERLRVKVDAATQELAYFKRMAIGYLSLIEEDEEKKSHGTDGDFRKNVVEGLRANATGLPPLHVDCANGVGFVAFEKLMALFDVIREKSSTNTSHATTTTTTRKEIALVLKNGPSDGPVNLNCGSDFVQKNQRAPDTSSSRLSFVNQRCASVDGDCDRLVYFSIEEGENFLLCDGDKLSILIAFFLIEQLFLAGLAHKISLGIAHTAYSNGAFTKFCEKNGVETVCAKTGVKNVHKAAEENFDIGVYFESNGHGTALFSEETVKLIEKELVDELTRMSVEQQLKKEEEKSSSSSSLQSVILTTKLKALLTLKATIQTINPAVGDAISSVLLIEGILRKKGNMPFQEWHAMYRDLPTKQTKVKVRDRTVIECFDSERKCSKPEGLQQRIDEIIDSFSSANDDDNNNMNRAFVRPSGTEDIVRVYVEASDAATCEAIAKKVEDAVVEFC